MEKNLYRQRSVTGRSRRRLALHWFLVTGHWRRGSNFVIFPAPNLGTGRSRVTISFRRCLSAAQRNRSVIVSREIPSSSPKRSFPMLVQFGYFLVSETRERSFNRARQFSWLKGSCAA